MNLLDIIVRSFSGLFLAIAIPGLIHLIKLDIETMRDLKERDLI